MQQNLPSCRCLALAFLGAIATASADQLDIDTAVTGTSGDDVIILLSPTVAEALVEISTGDTNEPATTRATGIDALGGDDQISLNAALAADATTRIEFDIKTLSTLGNAFAIGIDAGAGLDHVTNNASLTATTLADSFIADFWLPAVVEIFPGWPTESMAQSTGIDGDLNADVLVNGSRIASAANARSEVAKGRVDALSIPITLPSWSADTRNTSTATSVGMAGGADGVSAAASERITNTGVLDIDATASALTVEVAAELVGAARLDNATRSEATATGIAGGDWDSIITNAGDIDIDADANAESGSGELKWKGLFVKPIFDLIGLDVGNSSTTATAEAIGITGAGGNDTIVNDASGQLFDVYGRASSSSYEVTLALNLTFGGEAATSAAAAEADVAAEAVAATSADDGAAFGSAATKASAEASGIRGGRGNDTLNNNASLKSEAVAEAHSLGISADVSLSRESYLPIPGVAVADTSTSARATAMGLDGGAGDDSVENAARLDAIATADIQSTTVSATIKGSLDGLALGGAASKASSYSTALATGIADAQGMDSLRNSDVINVQATSRNDASSVSVNVGGEKIGMAFGVALANASATTSAHSFGIDTLGQDIESTPLGDNISNLGAIQAESLATATTLRFSANLAAALEGVAGGVTSVTGDGTAVASAAGIRSGSGADRILNEMDDSPDGVEASITAVARATGSSDSIALTFSGALEGVALGASLADSTTRAEAHAAGIDSGGGGDAVVNSATVISNATADVASNTISVTVALAPKGVSAGFAFSNAQTNAEAQATGIRSADGDDSITNQALVDVDALATTTTGTVTLNFAEIGAAIADVSSEARAIATGLEGGSGIDTLANAGTVEVTATAITDDTAGTANFIGAASGDVMSTATTFAAGMQSGASAAGGAQTMSNAVAGRIAVLSDARVDSSSAVIQGGGAAYAEIGAKSDAVASGLSGSVDADALYNAGSIDVVARSAIDANSFSFQLAGGTLGHAGINATGTAIGIFGDGGANSVINDATGAIDSYASIDTLATNVSGVLFGINVGVSGATADAVSQGIVTGDDADVIDNAGSVNATAAASGSAGSGSIGLFSFDLATSLSQATVEGIQAGDGDNVIRNSGTLTVGAVRTGDRALAHADSAAVSLDFFSTTLSTLGARASVKGIAVGTGDDIIVNSGTIAVGEANGWTAFGESAAFSGQIASLLSSAYGGSTAVGTAVGIDGGSGGNSILNDINGSIRVDTRSFVDAGSSTDVPGVSGGGTAKALAGASAIAAGIQTGAGDDTVMNAGSLDSHAYAFAYPHASTEIGTAVGNIIAQSDGTAQTTAVGIDAGGGKNYLQNAGQIAVTSGSETSTTSDADSVTTTTDSETTSLAIATAIGLVTGDDADELHNLGRIIVVADAERVTDTDGITLATTDERAYVGKKIPNGTAIADIDLAFFSSAEPPGARAFAQAIGMDGGVGTNMLSNDEAIDVTANAAAEGFADSNSDAYSTDTDASTYSNAAAIGLTTGEGGSTSLNRGTLTIRANSFAQPQSRSDSRYDDAPADAWARAEVHAHGVVTGGGGSTIVNAEGLVDVAVIASTAARARGDSGISGEGDARAKAESSATAVGLEILGGSNEDRNGVANHAVLRVRSDVVLPDGCNVSNGDCSARTHGDEYGTTVAEADAIATGIRTGRGQSQIDNTGSLTVDATTATLAWALGFHEVGDATATANAKAWGVSAGVGVEDAPGNVITNTGDLSVSAYAFARAYASPDSDRRRESVAATAGAVGIETGAGDDIVANHGSILVEASYETVGGGASGAVEAVGVNTGDGNDLIWNSGTIVARSGWLSPDLPDVSVRAGGGHDEIHLVGDSRLDGRVELGDGDDLLSFSDNAVVADAIYGGLGRDRLAIEDRGTFTVTPPTSIEELAVNFGKLVIDGDYALPVDGLLQAEIDDLGNGHLAINGNTALAGQLAVIAHPAIYHDGDRFDILSAHQIEASTEFASVDLPESTPLLSFGLDQRPEVVQVVAAVRPFVTVARNALELAIAEQLDRLAPIASGDLAQVIGSFQLVDEAEYDTAFASLSPDSHDNYTQASFAGTSLYLDVLSARMRSQRLAKWMPSDLIALADINDGTRLLSYNGSATHTDFLLGDEGPSGMETRRNAWATVYGQWGEQKTYEGYTGFDYDVSGLTVGLDHPVNPRLLVGAALAYSRQSLVLKDSRGDGDIDGWMGSLYGTYSSGQGYVDATLSYGNSTYEHQRNIRIGGIQRVAYGSHGGDVLAGSVGTGYLLMRDSWAIEPFGVLNYIRLDEESFIESGAGDIDQRIDARKSESLTSRVGIRIAHSAPWKSGQVITDASLGWKHDFDPDSRILSVAYSGAPDSVFRVPGRDLGSNGVAVQVGAGFTNSKGLTTSLGYAGEFRDKFSAQGVMASIRYEF